MKSNRSARMNAMHFRVLTARYFRQIFTNPGIFLPLLLEAPILLILLVKYSRIIPWMLHCFLSFSVTFML